MVYIIERSITYVNGKNYTSYVKSTGMLLTLTGRIYEAKEFSTKSEAQKIINKYKRSKSEKFKIIKKPPGATSD